MVAKNLRENSITVEESFVPFFFFFFPSVSNPILRPGLNCLAPPTSPNDVCSEKPACW